MSVPVLIVGNFLSGANGSRGVCEELAQRLKARGWPVLTVSSQPGRVPRLWDMLHTVLSRRNAYAVAQVDVFSGPAFIWAELVCAALRHCQRPYILTLHGGNLPAFARRWPRRVRALLNSAQIVTTPSRYLLSQLGYYRSDMRLVPNALALAGYHFRLRNGARPSLIWLRAFHEIYDPVLAVRVLKHLTVEFPQIRLTMVGPDKSDGSRQRAEQEISRAKLDSWVAFAGQVLKQDVPGWLQRGDIFLNTTTVDNAPVSVVEALACGLCVVSTNIGGLPYLLAHDADALLVPPRDPIAMALAVRRLLREPALAERLSRAGRIVAERHDWSLVLPQWENLLMTATHMPVFAVPQLPPRHRKAA